eukprot:17168_6
MSKPTCWRSAREVAPRGKTRSGVFGCRIRSSSWMIFIQGSAHLKLSFEMNSPIASNICIMSAPASICAEVYSMTVCVRISRSSFDSLGCSVSHFSPTSWFFFEDPPTMYMSVQGAALKPMSGTLPSNSFLMSLTESITCASFS